MALQAATRLGPYEITGTLGAGAMGEVYRARDTRLNRDVALKIIPPDAARDTARLRRFEKEAQAASSLNHPNIVAVYDIGVDSGTAYIVSELVEGESLRKVIQRGVPPVKRLLELGTQMADGLAAAHQAGIVHRDLKPENIMVTRDGRVKILDFGLAKPVSAALPVSLDETAGGNRTEPGLILGTVGYMSPEQATGASVGIQSDQFSLGVILHELATGVNPFRRESPLQTLTAILHDEPPFTPGPAPFRWLVEKCLQKDASLRYATTQELHEQLRRIRDSLAQTPTSAGMKPPDVFAEPVAGRTLPLRAALALATAFALGALLTLALPTRHPVSAELQHLPVATEAALELSPSWSPDAQSLAYVADVGGIPQVFRRSFTSIAPTQLTREGSPCSSPFWSPDGNSIYYLSGAPGEETLRRVSATGGPGSLVLESVSSAALSPDGRRLAVTRPTTQGSLTQSLWIGAANGSALQQVRWPQPGPGDLLAPTFLRFSPDGRFLAVSATEPAAASSLWLMDSDGAKARRVLPGLPPRREARAFDWFPDSQTLLLSARAPQGLADHLWRASTRDGNVTPVTNGVSVESQPAVARDGTQAAFSTVIADYDLVELPLDGSPSLPLRSTSLDESSPAFSPDGESYAYTTVRTGRPEIWLRSQRAGWERQVVTPDRFRSPGNADETLAFHDINFAPDGQRIAFRRVSSQEGERIWIATLTGDPPARLTLINGDPLQRHPSWSPDGSAIVYAALRGGHFSLLRATVGNSAASIPLGRLRGTQPRWSPQADRLAFLDEAGTLQLTSTSGAPSRSLGQGPWWVVSWSPDGRSLIGIRTQTDRRPILVSVQADTGQERILSTLDGMMDASRALALGIHPFRNASVSPDGTRLLTSVVRPRADIWLLRGLPAPSPWPAWLSR